ncbi:hypothetical protein D0S48_19615 [Psychrobacillus sp. AK 1817]|uniref:hypothetical protein n=1 Tax=Psychrobacillus sp. AK 1817 TaxID=2303505 RepID=UPI0012446D98|nr:hypothetical protein [Psychrobacillus sp. AK 1817]QEY22677.1 hypothetical protein D0S48_19615 [Psychrobacillus sp. AK 1817]
MKNLIIAALIFPALLITTATLAEASTKVMWGKTELRNGQIGKVTVLCTTQLYQKDNEGILRHSNRPLYKGEEFRVLKYETPSKLKLALLKTIL